MSERRDPYDRPSDPAGTRPKVRPEDLRPKELRGALPAGEPAGEQSVAAAPAPPLGATSATPAAAALPAPAIADAVPAAPIAAGPPALPAAVAGAPPHAPRFQFMLGAFGALAVAGIVLAVSLALAPKSKPGPPWSAWKPAGDVDPAVQIAQHVAPEYTLSRGTQLVSVTGGPQAIGGQPVVLALRRSGSSPAPLPENGVFYQLCGAGPSCSIPGKPSTARGLLVQREALELALYTFHYLKDAEQVVVTYPPLPPTKGTKSSTSAGEEATSAVSEGLSAGSGPTHGRALLFRPADLEEELSRPLAATLSSPAPSIAAVERAPEARLVDNLTGPLVYNFEVTQQQSTLIFLLQSPSVG